MYIYSAGSYHDTIRDEELPNLKQAVKDSCGTHVRRIDRFIQLGLIGSHRCAAGFELPENTGLYLSSGQGPKGNIANALEQIYKEKQPLMPLDFINMVGNSASFYIAKTLNIHGSNIFLTRKTFCFEAALELAYVDIKDGTCDQALVGCIDECMLPLEHHRHQLGVSADTLLGEGSHWLHIGNQKQEKPIAKIHHLIKFSRFDAVMEWARQHIQVPEKTLFAIGSHLAIEHSNKLAQLMPISDYSKEAGYYNCLTGLGINRYLLENKEAHKLKNLLHIDQSLDGRFSLILLERL